MKTAIRGRGDEDVLVVTIDDLFIVPISVDMVVVIVVFDMTVDMMTVVVKGVLSEALR